MILTIFPIFTGSGVGRLCRILKFLLFRLGDFPSCSTHAASSRPPPPRSPVSRYAYTALNPTWRPPLPPFLLFCFPRTFDVVNYDCSPLQKLLKLKNLDILVYLSVNLHFKATCIILPDLRGELHGSRWEWSIVLLYNSRKAHQ